MNTNVIIKCAIAVVLHIELLYVISGQNLLEVLWLYNFFKVDLC